MRNLRNSAMELGETRQLVIPCQRCGESRVILAKQGCDSNTLSESVNAFIRLLLMDGWNTRYRKITPQCLTFFCQHLPPHRKEFGKRVESRLMQVRREVIESNPMFAGFLQQSSPTAAPVGSVSIRRTSS